MTKWKSAMRSLPSGVVQCLRRRPSMPSLLGISLFGTMILLLYNTNIPRVDFQPRSSPQRTWISSYFAKQSAVNCNKLIAGDSISIQEAIDFDTHHRNVSILHDEAYLNLTAACDAFLDARGYSRRPLSDEEASFPIAFSISFYQHVEEFERLLRLIYQPQNVYCIYVDAKANGSVLEATQSIVRCLPNVFLAENRSNVVYASYSLLEALSLSCSRQLLQYEWKYYVNLVSQMFPLRTNREMVQLFKLMAGFNLVEASDPQREWRHWRWQKSFRIPTDTKTPYGSPSMTDEAKPPPLYNLTYVVGGAHVAASRALVQFVFSNDIARRYMHWLEDTFIPDEAFWTTVNWNTRILQSPGGYDIVPCDKQDDVFNTTCVPDLVRYIRWGLQCGPDGLVARGIGVLNAHCLSDVVSSPRIAANKFHLNYNKAAYECMEEWYNNRTASRVQLQDSHHILKLYNATVTNMQRRSQSTSRRRAR